ncbi:hypothetical protein AJ80_01673 [Polytolypa hystricis UAMH7299]|uniref:Dolichyl-phosphate-mannose--protein mannosyltransferase n=1 Tax=Polytolypa hystricis (strain UAMH7299) TaxID=1447883 RepID=A0A2B7Z1M0_POLH7|nr:hypothetical protein AJ80_01673 [Polytolypa hystricis UAMH7299]
MGSKSGKRLDVKSPARASRSPSRSPAPKNRRPVPAAKSSNYGSEGVKNNDILQLPVMDYKIMLVVTAIATVVRLFRIYQPTSVVFDEVHFGGFATKYIKGKFFMDVHPPLAKLLITLAGYLAGFDGSFDFKEIGKDYIEPGVPYVAMRMFPAIMGILSVPTMFLTLKAYGCRTTTAAMGSILVTFENGLTTQSRFILLDSPLIAFTALTALAFTCFTNQQEQGPSKAFGFSWWFWLATTGLFLGATLSIKWVGLFTIAWVGSLTILQLWVLLGDTRTVTLRVWFKHFFARVFCLIVIPLAFYCAIFAIHFLCLVNPGDGDGFMSSEFQSTLNSKRMQDTPVDVAFGSRITLRHHNTQGGYLHSHSHMYPTGSKQQQITLYPHKDENNIWIFENQTQPLGEYGEVEGPKAWDNITVGFIEDGTTVKLYHAITDRRLHSHDVRPPITEAEWQNEVSAYGYEGFGGDANDLFRVEIVKSLSDGEDAKKRVRTIQTKFKLVHLMTGCVLFSHKVKLPDWGFEQQEVTCARGGSLPNSIWYVEQNDHPMLGPDAERVNYRKPGFFGKFWELQKVMWKTNAGLVESHAWDSRPSSWPTLLRGINFWGRDHRQIYLMGNPVIWWSSTVAIALYVVFKGISIIRWQRGYGDYKHTTFKRFDYELGQTVLGWAFHYFPFYLMARQLFLHHYFPALYFAILAFCQVYDFGANRISMLSSGSKHLFGKAFLVLFVSLSITAFTVYSPLAYGNPWTQAACRRTKLLGSWDYDCKTFYTDLAKYSTPLKVGSKPPRSSSPVVATPEVKAPRQQPPPQQQQQQQHRQEAKVAEVKGDNSAVTPLPVAAESLVSRVDSVVYRDQDGNILNEEQVAELQKDGKVSFETRYETRTRVIDAEGRELSYEQKNAPDHPDAEGQNPETAGKNDEPASPADKPASVPGEEKSVERDDDKPKPASEGNEATQKHDDL